MNSENFAYWLQGFFELSRTNELTPEQVQAIKNHLNLVFKHDVDPKAEGPEAQKELNQIGNHGFKKDKLLRC